MVARLFTASRLLIHDFLDRCDLALFSFWNRYMGFLEDAVAGEVQKLIDLTSANRVEMMRIAPAIYDAAMCHHSFHWRPILRNALRRYQGPKEGNPRRRADPKNRPEPSLFPVLFVIFIIGFMLYILILILISVLSIPRIPGLFSVSGIIVGAVAALVLIYAGLIIIAYLPYTARTGFLAFTALCAIIAIKTFHQWAPEVYSAWRSGLAQLSTEMQKSLSTFQPARALLLAAWLVAVLCIVRVVARTVRYFGAWITGGRPFPGYGSWGEQCAALVLGFLDVSHILTEATTELSSPMPSDAKEIGRMLPPGELRQNVDQKIRRLAFVVRGPWRDAMRTRRAAGSKSVGEWLSQQAPRIEFFLQSQRVRNTMSGTQLIDLRDAMIQAMVQAADGNWHLIGAEEGYPLNAVASRWKSVTRRIIAIAIPLAAAVAVLKFAHAIPAPYVQAIILTLLGFAALQLLGLLDPDAPARLDIASKMSQFLKH